jgi:hypothetical protein
LQRISGIKSSSSVTESVSSAEIRGRIAGSAIAIACRHAFRSDGMLQREAVQIFGGSLKRLFDNGEKTVKVVP